MITHFQLTVTEKWLHNPLHQERLYPLHVGAWKQDEIRGVWLSDISQGKGHCSGRYFVSHGIQTRVLHRHSMDLREGLRWTFMSRRVWLAPDEQISVDTNRPSDSCRFLSMELPAMFLSCPKFHTTTIASFLKLSHAMIVCLCFGNDQDFHHDVTDSEL